MVQKLCGFDIKRTKLRKKNQSSRHAPLIEIPKQEHKKNIILKIARSNQMLLLYMKINNISLFLLLFYKFRQKKNQ